MRINKQYFDIDWAELKKKFPNAKGKGVLKKIVRKLVGIERARRKKINFNKEYKGESDESSK